MSRDSAQTSHGQAVNRLYQLLTDPGSRYLVLQGLVTIILSYELLFGVPSIISRGISNTLVMGFWLALVAIGILPRAVLASAWFSAGLVTIDTILVTSVIYLSGNARSDLLYLRTFVLMLVAASVRRLSHVLGLSLLLSVGYAVVLYEGILQTGTMATGQLLGIPVLLVMAVFYGVALENTAIAQEENNRY
ncbi:MAG: hypothetical protein HC801_06600 [Nitrospira sp.]|nr:hypothetical protein [Nitrospira sp.]